jgi:hypothetical protein
MKKTTTPVSRGPAISSTVFQRKVGKTRDPRTIELAPKRWAPAPARASLIVLSQDEQTLARGQSGSHFTTIPVRSRLDK